MISCPHLPTGRRGRPSSVATATEPAVTAGGEVSEYTALLAVLEERERENDALRRRVSELELSCRRKDDTLRRLRAILDESANP